MGMQQTSCFLGMYLVNCRRKQVSCPWFPWPVSPALQRGWGGAEEGAGTIEYWCGSIFHWENEDGWATKNSHGNLFWSLFFFFSVVPYKIIICHEKWLFITKKEHQMSRGMLGLTSGAVRGRYWAQAGIFHLCASFLHLTSRKLRQGGLGDVLGTSQL